MKDAIKYVDLDVSKEKIAVAIAFSCFHLYFLNMIGIPLLLLVVGWIRRKYASTQLGVLPLVGALSALVKFLPLKKDAGYLPQIF